MFISKAFNIVYMGIEYLVRNDIVILYLIDFLHFALEFGIYMDHLET